MIMIMITIDMCVASVAEGPQPVPVCTCGARFARGARSTHRRSHRRRHGLCSFCNVSEASTQMHCFSSSPILTVYVFRQLSDNTMAAGRLPPSSKKSTVILGH